MIDFDICNLRLKKLCKVLIIDYTDYVREAVKSGKVGYKETGIDDDLEVYREYFLMVLGLSLGLSDSEPLKDRKVKEDLIQLLKRDLSYRCFYKLSQTHRTKIYGMCSLIFNSVVSGIKELGGDDKKC